jgi:hypothetical protein
MDDRPAAVAAWAAVAAVVASLITLGVTTHYTNEINHKQQQLTEQDQINERYSVAVDQLGSDKLEVRLSGIYSLERVIRESRLEQPIIVEILSAYIRNRAPLSSCGNFRDGLATDVQATLTVLGRRDLSFDDNKVRPDLNRTCLVGADLTDAALTRANLTFADLTCAHLSGARLDDAELFYTQMGNADLTSATLTEAILTHTVLNDAILTRTNLTHATLDHVDLTRAKVTPQQLAAAKPLIATKTPKRSPRPSPCPK